MNKKLLKASFEELHIDAVAEAISNNEPIEQVVEEVQQSVNEDTGTEEAVAKAENLSNQIDETQKTTTALEQLVEIVQNTNSTGGLNPSSANMLNSSIQALCKPVGFSFESIDTSNFESFSKRLKYTTESVDTIKAMISKIWKMIIDGLRGLISFYSKLRRFFESDMYKYMAEVDKLKTQFGRVNKVTPEVDKIEGLLPQILLEDSNKTSSQDVLQLGETTIKVLSDFVSIFRKDLGSAVTSINNFSDNVLDIPMSADKDLEFFKKEDLKNFGEFFGTHLSTRMKHVNDSDIPKPTNTMNIFESDVVAGNYKFTMFVGDRNNLESEDILKSRLYFNVKNDEDTPSSVDVCDINHFRKMFNLVDDLVVVARRSFETVDYMETEVKKVLSKAEAAYSKTGKQMYDILNSGKIQTNHRFGVPVYNELSITLKRFYSDPSLAILKFITRYLKALTSYLSASLKEYA